MSHLRSDCSSYKSVKRDIIQYKRDLQNSPQYERTHSAPLAAHTNVLKETYYMGRQTYKIDIYERRPTKQSNTRDLTQFLLQLIKMC